jgi:hypothetical protein
VAPSLARHGSYAGYRRELETDNVCERCRIAARVYNSQRSKSAKARGIHYTSDQVIDHLYNPGRKTRSQPGPDPIPTRPASSSASPQRDAEPAPNPDSTGYSLTAEPSMVSRISESLRHMITPDGEAGYVDSDDAPEYLHQVNPDPEPESGNWDPKANPEYIINPAGYKLIEDNLSIYLSAIGITVEVIDPYCGPILADNFDMIVKRWSKVIGRYPAAAKLFMSEGGGVLMTWVTAIQATWPVLYAVYEHHLAKTVRTEKSTRRVMRVNVNGDMPDETTATMPGYEYTVGN